VMEALGHFREEMGRFGFHKALISIWEALGTANRYVDHAAPWNLAKDEALRGRLQTAIRTLLEVNRIVAVLISPFMPETAEKMLDRLGVPKKAEDLSLDEDARWGTLAEGAEVSKGEALFPRIETAPAQAPQKPEEGSGRQKAKTAVSKEAQQPGKPPKEAVKTPSPASEPQAVLPADADLIDFETFKRVDIRVGEIRQAERVPHSEKLVRLIVDIGEERQVVAGIAKTHSPEELVGKQVVVVANLKPAKLMGIESRGMILAVRDGDGLELLTPERKVTPGGKVS
jgi:methionyl-tRNA synthetase